VRARIVLGMGACAAAIPLALIAQDFFQQDSGLDAGGAWYGNLGCEFQAGTRIYRIVIDKSDRRLSAFSNGMLVRQFPVALGGSPVGQKQREGDKRTPEGIYPITEHKRDSAFHLALRLGYPTQEQASSARKDGIDPGKDIMIHGLRNGMGWIGTAHRPFDWTNGCIALTNGEIAWLFDHSDDGIPVDIRA